MVSIRSSLLFIARRAFLALNENWGMDDMLGGEYTECGILHANA